MHMLWWIAGAASLLMVVLWLWQQRHRDAGIVDAGWALALAAAAIALGVFADGHPANRALVAVLGGIWGLRLGLYVVVDRLIGKPEDGRYQHMRAWLGRHAGLGFFIFFQMQAGFVVLFAVPFAIVANTLEWSWLHAAIAVPLIVAGVGLAWHCDRVLAAFRNDPAQRGQVCQRSWWRYSRHPNYFFEWMQWWGWAVLCLAQPLWWGWLGVAMVPIVAAFLLYLTGIPHVERRALKSRGEAYARYQRTTSAFIPWPPRP